ncbi:hypothetical protein JD79_04386 [Geodermatophilus normandii]|uniref:Uncharacterized protein n=1 Tax=Geodermatophilus normandii TaxID=1137989 RepID=A0A317QNU0_9ACTN|nr:hypothetical protein JD79_04386 [Geodermatophilus normandii]
MRVVALLSTLGATDAVTGRAVGEGEPATALPVPPNRSLPGIASDSGAWRALTRTAPGADAPGCRELTLRASPDCRAGGYPEVSVLVELVAAADFERRTGNAVPQLRPDAPYGGRQLP